MSDKKLSVWLCPRCGEIAKPDRDWEPGLDAAHTPYHHHGEDPMPVPAEDVEVIPVDSLLSDGVEALAKLNYAKHVHAMDYPEDWEGETVGHRALWRGGALEQIQIAISAAEGQV
jgi:hypothetical protein